MTFWKEGGAGASAATTCDPSTPEGCSFRLGAGCRLRVC